MNVIIGDTCPAGCVFCEMAAAGRWIGCNERAFAIRDSSPVTPLHTLILPKRHVADFFLCTDEERRDIMVLLFRAKEEILEGDLSVSGFNVGVNIGKSAGQTVFHVHVHLIPRRDGDVKNPRGGVRGVIPEKQCY